MFPSYLRGLAAVQYIAVPYMGDDQSSSSSLNVPDEMGFKRIFSQWEKRVIVMLSMILQIVLFWWTYQRKKTASRPRRVLFLGAFLAADSTAVLCLGVVFHANMSTKASANPQNKYLLALWAPFMLIHLGRHSRITAFSLGENEFWLGHLIRFIYFEFTALYICCIAWSEQRFHTTSILLFIMGTIRYGERVLALKFGSLNVLRSFNNFREEYQYSSSAANKRGEISIDMQLVDPRVEVIWTVADVYRCFEIHKGIYTDILFTNTTRDKTEMDPSTMDSINAFKFMETELSFAYDMFYTKSVCSDTLAGWIARWISLFSICAALCLFVSVTKHGFLATDVGLTYGLLIIALILELASFVEAIASNRTKVLVGSENAGAARRNLEGGIGRIQSFVTRMSPVPQLSVGQFNLLHFCFNDRQLGPWRKWVYKFFEVKDFLDNWQYTSYSQIEDGEFRRKVFDRVGERLGEENATTLFHNPIGSSSIPEFLADNTNFRQFERCLLIWHLSTDLCHRYVHNPSPELQNAKILSDYMIYLLVLHPSLLSPIVITTEVTDYQDLCAELMVFYSDPAFERLGLSVHNDNDFQNIERYSSSLATNSLLREGIQLAGVLKTMSGRIGEDNNTWEMVFKVWVDMLSFVACWSTGKQHAELLGKGEELITYVRLFMSHSGCHFSVDIPAQEAV